MTYMLDTNICIYAINYKPRYLVDKLREHDMDDFRISSITFSELMYGVSKSKYVEKNKIALSLFLSNIKIIDFDAKAAEEYGIIRTDLEKQGTPIGSFDMLIAAHAKASKYILITNNEREFKRVNGLNVENWITNN